MGKKVKPRVIPEQDGRIIGTICLCQLTLVLSAVALVYLSVAVYAPSHRAFNSGYHPVPVVCETVNMTMAHNCSWASCGEWCLTRTSGFCPQMMVVMRRNGSRMALKKCTRFHYYKCPPVRTDLLPQTNCNKEDECQAMSGIFNCSLGHCANLTALVKCDNRGEGPHIDVDKNSPKLNGFYECHGSSCMKIKHPLECERYCPTLTTDGAFNVLVRRGDSVLSALCDSALVSTATSNALDRGSGTPWWQRGDGVLLVNCFTTTHTNESIMGTDCVNGTMLPVTVFPNGSMSFAQLRYIWEKAMDDEIARKHHKNRSEFDILPPTSSLALSEKPSRLLINLGGCVNTLRGECRQFVEDYGGDGRNYTSRNRFPCFYNKKNYTQVLARFDLAETWRELLVAVIVPSVLLVISLATLCIMTRSVKVGDDAKLRCLMCCSRSSASVAQPTPTPT